MRARVAAPSRAPTEESVGPLPTPAFRRGSSLLWTLILPARPRFMRGPLPLPAAAAFSRVPTEEPIGPPSTLAFRLPIFECWPLILPLPRRCIPEPVVAAPSRAPTGELVGPPPTAV